MKQNTLFFFLKLITILAGLFGLFLCFWLFPHIGGILAAENPEISYYYFPWLILIWSAAVPCYGALVLAWKLFCSISRGCIFTFTNAKLLQWISILVLGGVLFFFLMNIIYLLLDMNHPGIVLLSLLIVFVGFSFSVTSFALSYLTKKAAELQEFNDAVI